MFAPEAPIEEAVKGMTRLTDYVEADLSFYHLKRKKKKIVTFLYK